MFESDWSVSVYYFHITTQVVLAVTNDRCQVNAGNTDRPTNMDLQTLTLIPIVHTWTTFTRYIRRLIPSVHFELYAQYHVPVYTNPYDSLLLCL